MTNSDILASITVHHEDLGILVVEKPTGLPVIPGRYDTDCLLHRLEAARGEKLWVVHRIDQETSGIVVFARDAAMHRHLSMAFEKHAVKKRYIALLDGTPKVKEGRVDAALRQFGSGRMGVDPAKGKPCTTNYRVIATTRTLSMVEAEPLTGRRHQLRVHFHHLGTPVAGDPLYGDKERQKTFPRMFLHAQGIVLPLPDGAALRLESPLPAAFTDLGFSVPAWNP